MGKSSIIIVMGFLIIVGLAAPNINRMASGAYENFLVYNENTMAHNIAVSGANVGANAVFLTPTWRSTISNVAFSGGSFTVRGENYGGNQVRITSVGTFGHKSDTVVVILGPSTYSKFAYYAVVEGGNAWITGDTVRGPFHTQGKMNIVGTPAYYGKVTNRLGTNPKNTAAKFYGGYETGVNLPLPADFTNLIAAATSNGQVEVSGDLYLNFNGDSLQWKTSPTGPSTTVRTSDFAPNGVIMAASGNVHVQGTVSGRVTISALGGSGGARGNIYVDDDIRYTTDPRYGTSNDMLGLICENNVIIADNAANNSNVTIQASILCLKGAFVAENSNTRPIAGSINLLGGVVQHDNGSVASYTTSGGLTTVSHGFHKNYIYDDRLMHDAPPFYPVTGAYETLSWYE